MIHYDKLTSIAHFVDHVAPNSTNPMDRYAGFAIQESVVSKITKSSSPFRLYVHVKNKWYVLTGCSEQRLELSEDLSRHCGYNITVSWPEVDMWLNVKPT